MERKDIYDINVNRTDQVFLLGANVIESVQSGITALAGGGQTGATLCQGQTSLVSTVATTGDSVALPPAKVGLEVTLINKGANPMQVYGSGTDTIDDVAYGTGVSQMQNSYVLYTCASSGKWYSEGLASGFAGPGLSTQSTQDSLTAKAGGGQGGGPTINRMLNRITTVTTGNDSITLPASASGMYITIVNAAAANSMNVFPATGEYINALAQNAAFAVAAGKTASFFCATSGQWHSILSA